MTDDADFFIGKGYACAMPTIIENQKLWQTAYHWSDGGEEWSASWGGSDAQWKFCIHPRIASFIPARSILEIAPGYGRWTKYLLPECRSYIGVDLAERCTAACQERFKACGHARFITNDGRSLLAVADSSVDFAFSFDSLVHCEDDVIAAYLRELRRVLTSDGVAFIHHSNSGAYRVASAFYDQLRGLSRNLPLPRAVRARGNALTTHAGNSTGLYRARSVTAARFYHLSRSAGLACIGQEVINWTTPALTDCISIVTQLGSRWDRPNVRVTNRHFGAAGHSAAAATQVFTLS